MAIRLKLKKAEGEYDLGVSKFLGSPTIPDAYMDIFPDSAIFLAQIRLEDIKELDKENLLPHHGYLYIFLDTEEGDYNLKPIIKYFDGEPTTVVEQFNSTVDGYEEYVDDYLIEFEECDDGESCTRLFGYPADWNYQDEPRKLMMQFDPLDSEMGIFDHIDGLFYFFFKDAKRDIEEVEMMEEYS